MASIFTFRARNLVSKSAAVIFQTLPFHPCPEDVHHLSEDAQVREGEHLRTNYCCNCLCCCHLPEGAHHSLLEHLRGLSERLRRVVPSAIPVYCRVVRFSASECQE